jgi:hypothetical protein
MTQLVWDQVGQKKYETGVDHGVLYLADNAGNYDEGFAWNGLVSVTESPSGAEPNKQYADNIVYVNLISAEEFSATIEAFTYPDEFAECDGSAEPTPGVVIGQQDRRGFGLSYRTKIGNDTGGQDFGFKVHLVYGGMAAPTEKAYTTVNDSPEAATFSWEVSTTPVPVGTIAGVEYKPTATLVIDSTKVDAAALSDLLTILYGTNLVDPRLPSPAEVVALFSGTVTDSGLPLAPTYNPTTDVVTIPTVTGVDYYINDEIVTGTVTITADTIVTAKPKPGFKFPPNADNDWFIDFS